MARVETRESGERLSGDQPPEEDGHLEDWFARRLESQGIPANRSRPRPSNARLLAVAGLAVALLGLVWAFSSAGGGSTTTTTTAPTQPQTTPTTKSSTGSTKSSGKTSKAPAWNAITVDILNGYGGSGAAAAAAQTLQTDGWKTGQTADAGTTSIPNTIVVYAPGFARQAGIVAHKMGLARPLPISSVEGVTPTATAGVAVVLGPNGLPSSTTA